jgi:hypothetical protein
MSAYHVFMLPRAYVAALRQADPPNKESYRLSNELIVTDQF